MSHAPWPKGRTAHLDDTFERAYHDAQRHYDPRSLMERLYALDTQECTEFYMDSDTSFVFSVTLRICVDEEEDSWVRFDTLYRVELVDDARNRFSLTIRKLKPSENSEDYATYPFANETCTGQEVISKFREIIAGVKKATASSQVWMFRMRSLGVSDKADK
ncbi:MAG: hypothetical protein AAGF19_02415 [Pseudomonadota bacterium]